MQPAADPDSLAQGILAVVGDIERYRMSAESLRPRALELADPRSSAARLDRAFAQAAGFPAPGAPNGAPSPAAPALTDNLPDREVEVTR